MSSLWTPGGEHRVEREPAPGGASAGPPSGGDPGDLGGALDAILSSLPPEQRAEFERAFNELSDEEREEYLERLMAMADTQARVVESPIEVMVGNHAMGLFELAALHLQQQPPHLVEAKLAIDALAALLAGVAGRLGEHETELKTMLTQIQLAFVQLQGQGGGAPEADDGGDDA